MTTSKEKSIRMLKGPGLVRLRPGVIFGSSGVEGAIVAVRKLFTLFGTEAYRGHCTRIELTLHADHSFTLKSFDRGIFLGPICEPKQSYWYPLFCELYASPKRPTASDQETSVLDDYHDAIYGDYDNVQHKFRTDMCFDSELTALQYATDFMKVEVVRDGEKKRLDFSKGYHVGGLTATPDNGESYTQIHCKLDSDVFTEIRIPEQAYIDSLKEWAIYCPKLTCVFRNELTGTGLTIQYPTGIVSFVRESSNDSSMMPVFFESLQACGKERYNHKEYEAEVNVAIQLSDGSSLQKCYHNFRELSRGGTHFDAAIRKICSHIFEFVGERYVPDEIVDQGKRYDYRRKHEITFDELKTHLILVVETKCSPFYSRWINGTRQSIENIVIRDMVYDAIGQAFVKYLRENETSVYAILDRIVSERKGLQ